MHYNLKNPYPLMSKNYTIGLATCQNNRPLIEYNPNWGYNPLELDQWTTPRALGVLWVFLSIWGGSTPDGAGVTCHLAFDIVKFLDMGQGQGQGLAPY